MESIPRKDDVSVIAGTARRNVAAGKGTGRSLFSRSDSEILDLTSATHVPDHPQEHTSSDVSSLLSTTEVIIVRSNEVISDILRGLQPSDIKSSSSTSAKRREISYEGSSDEIAVE
ncbi:uncharacterized protein LOC125472793 isoform X2 [Pyrus x bretschneideri]|uniref:uncharacterized protein LOC125472793 isoform X2 n=1 Tax=Pyrus x bretschneideri TaxID=225117 RepID=UPI00202FDB98|nr:uncharacterized protein LOC125472793 isoform X2 [Pyrus x bretschneideri]